MNHLLAVLGKVYELFNIPLNIYGFQFSLWGVMIFSLVVGTIFYFVGYLFYEN